MKTRFGYLIVAAITAVSFSLSAVADVESVTPAGFYQVEVTPQVLGEMDAIAVQAAIGIQTEQSLEAMVIGPGSSNVGSGSGDSPMAFARTDSGGLADDWEGFLRPKNDGIRPNNDGAFAKVSTCKGLTVPFEVGWKTVNS